MSPALVWSIDVLALALGVLTAVMSALLERSGLIRLRLWAAESGGQLEALYGREGRFEVYRLLLSLASRLSVIVVLAITAVLTDSIWLASAVATSMVLLAEFASRFLSRRDPEAALASLTGLYRVAFMLISPVVRLLRPIFPYSAMVPREESLDDEEASGGEIDAYISVGQREGILNPDEEILVKGVVEFGDTRLRSVMTPRIDMVMAPASTAPEELLELLLASGHSRLPLYGESPDEIVGVLHLRDLVGALHAGGPVNVADIYRHAFIVPDTKPIAALLRDLQARHQQLAVAVDEFGGTAGLATVEDLLEEIVGEISDEHDETDFERIQLGDDAWLLSGSADVEELEELFGIDLGETPYETIGGLVFTSLGHIPDVGERLSRYGLDIEVLKVADRRILQLSVERAAEAP